MLKAVQSLDKKWKELVYSASGFGPNFLMVLMGAYFSDAVNQPRRVDRVLFGRGQPCRGWVRT